MCGPSFPFLPFFLSSFLSFLLSWERGLRPSLLPLSDLIDCRVRAEREEDGNRPGRKKTREEEKYIVRCRVPTCCYVGT
ncbi:hypothetical protein LZ31DRAFT_312197 [Colletotrichum somersetense]|nr:hypothetical protein LZ31DRAFT_312197 [Colletotrichum somersetense]